MSQPLAYWLKEHYRITWFILFTLTIFPAGRLLVDFYQENLGVNPLQYLQQTTGFWTLLFLCISLSITPLRRLSTFVSVKLHTRYGKRLSDWNWIIRTRRLFGLGSFFYAIIHLGIYLHFDLDYNLQWAVKDFTEKPYLVYGLTCFTLLIPLAITSPKFMMKKMGKNWRRLHRLVYLIALLALVHVWQAVKSGINTPFYFTLVVGVLLSYRLLSAKGLLLPKARDDGMEVPPRK